MTIIMETLKQETIHYRIGQLLNTHSSLDNFMKDLFNFLDHLSQVDTYPYRKALNERIENAESQLDQISYNLSGITSTKTSLHKLESRKRNITKATLMESLQLHCEEDYQNVIDEKVLSDVVLLKEKAWMEKVVLHHRLWVTCAAVEGYLARDLGVGDLVLKMFAWEARVQSDSGDLFGMEQANREMALGLLNIR